MVVGGRVMQHQMAMKVPNVLRHGVQDAGRRVSQAGTSAMHFGTATL